MEQDPAVFKKEIGTINGDENAAPVKSFVQLNVNCTHLALIYLRHLIISVN